MYRHQNRIGMILLIAGAVSVPAHASSLEAYTGVIGGSNTGCSGAGGPPTAITSFFSDLGGFGLLTDPGGNGISDCGLSGAVTDMIAPTGPLTNSYALGTTPYSSYPTNSFAGSASATASYGSVAVDTSGTVNGVQGFNGKAETVAFGIDNDSFNLTGAPTGTGYMVFDYTLNASMTITNPANGGGGEMQVNVQVDNTNENIFYANFQGASVSVAGVENIAGSIYAGEPVPGCVTGSGTFTCTNASLQTQMLQVNFGAPITYDMGLLSDTNPSISQTVSDPTGLSLTGIQVYDSSGSFVSQFSITSDSGSSYGSDGFESGPASSPEPATFLLGGFALAAICGARRYRRSN